MFGDRIGRWTAELARRLDALLERPREMHGIPVRIINTRPDISSADALGRLAAALDLVARYAPSRLRRMRHDLSGILVQRFPCRAAYDPNSRTCIVELTFLVNPAFTPSEIAASIVHEGTHARLDRMGVHVPPDQRAREERLCRKAEVELGLAVPNGRAVLERAMQAMSLDDEGVAPSIDWAEAQRRVAAADHAALGGQPPAGERAR